MKAAWVYAALWIGFVLWFLAVEFTAIGTGNSKYTLSDFIWNLEQINRGWTFLRFLVCAFCVWLFFHMAFGWFRLFSVPCKTEGCQKPAKAAGLCGACYMRKYRQEHPEYVARKQARERRVYAENHEYYRDIRLKYKFGMSYGDYARILAAQSGVCAICGRPPGRKRLSVDHDRKCCPGVRSCGQCVRGLLCESCNRAVGLFRDDVAVLERALAYVARVVPVSENTATV